MSNSTFGVLAFCGLLGTVGALVAFNPRAIPRMTNAYYALIRMKSRLAEEDYDKVGIRVAGGLLFFLALWVLVHRWSQLWK
jgi:hypothetical protein